MVDNIYYLLPTFHTKFVKTIGLSNFQSSFMPKLTLLVSYYVQLNFGKMCRDTLIKGCSYQAPNDNLRGHQFWSGLKIWSTFHTKLRDNL